VTTNFAARVSVTKLDAARAQLREAITLFFEERSAVAIHTLVLASHQILHDYTGRTRSMIKNERAVREYGKERIERFNREFNFFKHAKSDAKDSLLFDPELHTFFLADALHLYAAATEEWPHEHRVFNFWFILKRPHMVETETAKNAIATARRAGWQPDSKQVFLELLRNPSLFGVQATSASEP
jgi:hypothetical protein